jgi:hypothetical protein
MADMSTTHTHTDLLDWLRVSDMTVVVWGGNDYDFDMNRLAEVKL